MLYISSSHWLLRTPKSWSKYTTVARIFIYEMGKGLTRTLNIFILCNKNFLKPFKKSQLTPLFQFCFKVSQKSFLWPSHKIWPKPFLDVRTGKHQYRQTKSRHASNWTDWRIDIRTQRHKQTITPDKEIDRHLIKIRYKDCLGQSKMQ